ncbi:hypothetical protein GGX14DRAFT_562018 [Mycena pura]|uniref:Uncharacterized protein n=1 Tax=Mycena pura TaxID=153505 RepID=A0AAD6VMU9_9AGAR|nr:hypothetical protein GGX14DRAFT_562018 [Mycena pura]
MSLFTSFLLNKNTMNPLLGAIVTSVHLAGYLTVNLLKVTDSGASVASRTSASIVASETIQHVSKASLSLQNICVFTFMAVAILSAVVTYQRQPVSSSHFKDGDEPPDSGESGTQGGPDPRKTTPPDADTDGRITSGDEPPPSPPSPGTVSEASRKPWTTWFRWLLWLLLTIAIQILWTLFGPSWLSILSFLTVGAGKGLGLMCVGWATGLPFEEVDELVLFLQETFYQIKDLGYKIATITGMLDFKIAFVFCSIYSTLSSVYYSGVIVCSCSKFIYKLFRTIWAAWFVWFNLLAICSLVVGEYFDYIVLTCQVALWFLQGSVLAIMYWLDELPFILNVATIAFPSISLRNPYSTVLSPHALSLCLIFPKALFSCAVVLCLSDRLSLSLAHICVKPYTLRIVSRHIPVFFIALYSLLPPLLPLIYPICTRPNPLSFPVHPFRLAPQFCAAYDFFTTICPRGLRATILACYAQYTLRIIYPLLSLLCTTLYPCPFIAQYTLSVHFPLCLLYNHRVLCSIYSSDRFPPYTHFLRSATYTLAIYPICTRPNPLSLPVYPFAPGLPLCCPRRRDLMVPQFCGAYHFFSTICLRCLRAPRTQLSLASDHIPALVFSLPAYPPHGAEILLLRSRCNCIIDLSARRFRTIRINKVLLLSLP